MVLPRRTPERVRVWAAAPAEALAWIGARAAGPAPQECLARHRTGWTARVDPPGLGPCVLKVYLYPGLETLSGFLRTTFLASSRPAREGAILSWLARHGLGPELAVAAGERRRLGWLARAWLLTRLWDAPDLARWIGRTRDPALAAALGAWLCKAHGLGLEDRNPHLRNFLARRRGNGEWELAKIDSPRAVLHRGPLGARARRRDLGRLCADARRLGAGKALERAFLAAYGGAQDRHSTS